MGMPGSGDGPVSGYGSGDGEMSGSGWMPGSGEMSGSGSGSGMSGTTVPPPTNPPTYEPQQGFRKIRKMQLKFRNALTVEQCRELAPSVCVNGLKLPANRCRFVENSNRRRLLDDDDLVDEAEYEADLLSSDEVDAVENQDEQEFLEDLNEALE